MMFLSLTKALMASIVLLTLCSLEARSKPLTYKLPDREEQRLRPGAGSDIAQNNCLSCHSVDYIETQPKNQGLKFWENEVSKMIKNYHAPISEEDAKIIADYLSKTY